MLYPFSLPYSTTYFTPAHQKRYYPILEYNHTHNLLFIQTLCHTVFTFSLPILSALIDPAKEFILEYGLIGLGIFSFTEGFINPIPISPIMAFAIVGAGLPMWLAFFVTVIANLLGAATGYYLGLKLGHPICVRLFGEKSVLKAEKFFQKWGVFGVFLVGFTPLPFKVVCWGAGIFEMRFWQFFVAATAGRFAHFLVVLGFVYFGWETFSFFVQ